MNNQNIYYMVTWEMDLTQFLVEAHDEKEAINKAIKAHSAYDENICERDSNDEDDIIFIEEMNDESTYTADSVDFDLLCEIIMREDCVGKFEEAIVYFGA